MPCDPLTPEDIFNCQQCGDCCKGFGGTYVSPEDVQAIAAFIHIDPRNISGKILSAFREKTRSGSGRKRILRFLERQDLHDSSRQAPDVQGLALYSKRSERPAELAHHGRILPRNPHRCHPFGNRCLCPQPDRIDIISSRVHR